MTYKGGCGWVGNETTRNDEKLIKKHVFTLSLSRTEGEYNHCLAVFTISTHLNPKLKPTITTTKACATYESVKTATLEERENYVEDEDRHELYIIQVLNDKTAHVTLAFGFRS
jgi:hypothetical protein